MLTDIYRNDHRHGDVTKDTSTSALANRSFGSCNNADLAIKGRTRWSWEATQDQMCVTHFTLVNLFDVSPKCRGMDEACMVEEIWDTRRHKRFFGDSEEL